MKSFNIETETVVTENFIFHGNQANVATRTSSLRVFKWRYIAGNVSNLPKYVQSAIRQAGFTAHYLGGTTFSHSVIGLALTTPNDERIELNSIYWGISNLKYLRERSAMAFALFPELKKEFAPRLVALVLEANK